MIKSKNPSQHTTPHQEARYKLCCRWRRHGATRDTVIKEVTIRWVFFIVISYGWKIHQLDIHNAFLNGILVKRSTCNNLQVLLTLLFLLMRARLHKSLYGLKQASRAWYTRLSDFLLSLGFHASKVNTSLSILSASADIFYLLVYVDDILFTSSDSTILQRLIQLLNSEFKIRYLGVVHYFLGIEVQSTSMGLMLWHNKYILDILTRAGMTSCKPVNTPKVIVLPDCLFSNPTRFH
jgi:hypothetical protein